MHQHITYEPHFCVELCCGVLYDRYNLMVDVEENTKFSCVKTIFFQTLFRSLSNTFRSVITPSWLTGLVKTVKETAKAEDTVPTKKVSHELI